VRRSTGLPPTISLKRTIRVTRFPRFLWIIILNGRTKSEYNRCMPGQPKLTPIQVLERLQLRLEQRMESLQRVKLDGYYLVISELETELESAATCTALSGGLRIEYRDFCPSRNANKEGALGLAA
jgi:hypothetical protein